MPQPRTVEAKVGDAIAAFNGLRDEVTPPPLRALIQKMTEVPMTEGTDVAAYASLVQSSIHLARIIAANDRATMIAAVMLTQSGVSRPIIDTGEDA